MATNKYILKLLHIKLHAINLGMPEAHECTTIYNDNSSAVSWASLLTNKGTKHINLRKAKVCEACADGGAVVKNIPGIINPSNLFTIMNLSKVFTPSLNTGNKGGYSGTSAL